MAGSWPNSQDYNEAVQNPGFNFSDPDLQAAEAVTSALGIPQACAGGFADVYQLRSADGQSWAVKCFTKRVERRQQRYAAISTHLQQAGLPFTVGFEFLEQGIRLQGDWYPVLKMDWVEGQTLANFVRDNLHKPKLLKSLLKIWLKVEPRLYRTGIAHGDLQHGNVMLIPGRTEDKLALKLIDYDGLWLSPLADQPSGEVGHPSYQHPERVQLGTYSADIDRFPHFVIAAALRCLSHASGPKLWEKYDTGENLLFSQSDFARPDESGLLHELWSSSDPQLQSWTGHLILAARSKLEATPRLVRLVEDRRIADLSAEDADKAARLLGGRHAGTKPLWMAHDSLETSTETTGDALTQSSSALPGPTGASLSEPTGNHGSPSDVPDWIDLDAAQPNQDEAGREDVASLPPLRRGVKRHQIEPVEATPRFSRSTWKLTAGALVLFFGVFALIYPGQTPSVQEPANSVDATENAARPGSEETPVAPLVPNLLAGATNAGEEWDDNGLGMKLVWCPPGSFTVGSTIAGPGGGNSENLREVTFTQGFWIGKYEVTQREWQSVMGTTPWQSRPQVMDADDCPATYVNGDEAKAFCAKLTSQERLGGRLPSGSEYSLPTEVQWEYACRAGTQTQFSFGDDVAQLDDYAWSAANTAPAGERYAHPVGQKRSNAWGLHDVHGNVWEWCNDRVVPSRSAGPGGGVGGIGGFGGGSSRVVRLIQVSRGGCWIDRGVRLKTAARGMVPPSVRAPFQGFRVVVVPVTTLESPPPSSVSPTASGEPKPGAPSTRWTDGTRTGEERDDNALQMKLVWCPPGSFTMGSPPNESGRQGAEEDQVAVTLTQGFWLGKYEVTQSQWQSVMQTTPWTRTAKVLPAPGTVLAAPDAPVAYTSWHEAVEYCRRLTIAERAAGRLPADWDYTLPTEAQWEYACRAGTSTRYSFGEDETQLGNFAWSKENADNVGEQFAHRVGQKRANAWGLHDMHGNVLEWCSDKFEVRLPGGTDPLVSGREPKVFRGGSWANSARYCRSAFRSRSTPGFQYNTIGFRVAAVSRSSSGGISGTE